MKKLSDYSFKMVDSPDGPCACIWPTKAGGMIDDHLEIDHLLGGDFEQIMEGTYVFSFTLEGARAKLKELGLCEVDDDDPLGRIMSMVDWP